MRAVSNVLINTPDIEVWPGGLLRARSNHDARLLSRARYVLRRKRDGRYLAANLPEGLHPLMVGALREAGMPSALAALKREVTGSGSRLAGTLPLHRLQERLDALGLDTGYAERSKLSLIAEPAWLMLAGFDRYRRPLWLEANAARAWSRMREAALRDDVLIEAISGYRSHAYQLGIFERKRARGLGVDDILAVNAAPGYSEHHSGRALDIGTPGEAAAEESFEQTSAFSWLAANAPAFGFTMSYPRDNPHGIVYEPWHWRFQPQDSTLGVIIPASA